MSLDKDKTVIYSPYPLSSEELSLIVKKFSFIDRVNLENRVDRTLLAGVIIHHHNKIIDLSLKRKLKSLEKKLYEINE